MWKATKRLIADRRGAVAPTVALSLFGLIACGGIAFDYAQLAALDTELQQAADQAALAAATQMDRADDSQTRATAAITDGTNTNRLAANLTRFANDGGDSTVEISSITFCSDFDDTEPDTMAACTATNDGAETRYVIVTTTMRTANYAFTPVVAAFSGTSTASAVAGVQSSICNVAPLLVCVADNDFPSDEDIGRGIVLKPFGGQGAWAPGNYGLLDFGNGTGAVTEGLLGHGLSGCQSTDDNETEPGTKATVTDAINTRMDVYATNNNNVWDNSSKAPKCDLSDGAGCPAKNARKDFTLEMTYEVNTAKGGAQPTNVPNCGATGGGISYADSFAQTNSANHFSRDTCHLSGGCDDGNFGDGSWDRDAYIAANHTGLASAIAAWVGGTATASTLTRHQIYLWEQATSGAMDTKQVGSQTVTSKDKGQVTTWTFKKQCNFAQPKLASTAYPEQKDRRVLPIVAADCTNLKGKGEAYEDYSLLRVFDVFLTEPSQNRTVGGVKVTDEKEIYAEVIGPAQTFEGGSGFQYYSRNKPYLVR